MLTLLGHHVIASHAAQLVCAGHHQAIGGLGLEVAALEHTCRRPRQEGTGAQAEREQAVNRKTASQ